MQHGITRPGLIIHRVKEATDKNSTVLLQIKMRRIGGIYARPAHIAIKGWIHGAIAFEAHHASGVPSHHAGLFIDKPPAQAGTGQDFSICLHGERTGSGVEREERTAWEWFPQRRFRFLS